MIIFGTQSFWICWNTMIFNTMFFSITTIFLLDMLNITILWWWIYVKSPTFCWQLHLKLGDLAQRNLRQGTKGLDVKAERGQMCRAEAAATGQGPSAVDHLGKNRVVILPLLDSVCAPVPLIPTNISISGVNSESLKTGIWFYGYKSAWYWSNWVKYQYLNTK